VPELSAVSVNGMTENAGERQTSERGWLAFNAAAAVLAIAGLASLAVILFVSWGGGRPWTGFELIAMIGLPIAFAMMGVGLLHAVARRRRL
jgi:hypothetical protein